MNTLIKRPYLLIAGLLVIALAQIISHYNSLSDFENGIMMGIGLGLSLLGLTKHKLKPETIK